MEGYERAVVLEDNPTGDAYETSEAVAETLTEGHHRAIHDLSNGLAVIEVKVGDADEAGAWVTIGRFTGKFQADNADGLSDGLAGDDYRVVYDIDQDQYLVERRAGGDD